MSSLTKTLSNGVQIPWIAYGTGTALYNQDAEAAVTLAIQSNFNHIDCAQIYRNEVRPLFHFEILSNDCSPCQQDTTGKAIVKVPRDSLFVTTKLATLRPGETVRESLQESLNKLGVQYVDLWLVHSPKQHEGNLKEVWKGCEDIYKEGLAKSVGVSNFTVKHLEEIMEVATVVPQANQVYEICFIQVLLLDFEQIELHPYNYKAAKPLLDFHKEHGIVTESYGGLAPLTTKPGGPVDLVIKFIREAVEKRRGAPVTEAQVIMKWLQAKDVVIVT